jgi:polysaccharide deacetylase 2 family uncharacterized protein YibQ
MAKKRRSTSTGRRAPFVLAALAALALVLFAGGEFFAFATSDLGRVLTYRHLHIGDRAQLVRITGKRIREGLAAARVPAGAFGETVAARPDGGTPVWQVDLPPDGAPLQVNYAITEAVRRGGARVLSASETAGADGALSVRLLVGVPGRTLHEVRIRRPERVIRAADEPRPVRLALLLVDIADDAKIARALLARHEPFAVAIPALGEGRAALRRAARAGGHELVLQIPMEPENYPRVNPGPGTLLVSMTARHIENTLRGNVEEAGDVIAVSNLMGSFATQDEPFMTAFYRELRRRKLPFLHVGAVPRSVCRELAASVGVAYDVPDAYLDREAREKKPAALERAWKAALARAQQRGAAVVVLRLTPTSAAWLDHALSPKALGAVTLVPLSSLLHRADER